MDDDTISGSDTMVQGIIDNATGNETGVLVNGTPALIYGNQFTANHVPLEEGENTITADATDTDGNFASASITVFSEIPDDYIRITADPASGVSLMETTLLIEGSFDMVLPVNIAYTGPGMVEFIESGDTEFKVRLTGEGIYFFTAEVADDQSNIYTDTVAVLVMDEATLDALLQAKWEGMKAALSSGEIEEAVGYLTQGRREMYEYNFTLMSAYLAEISAGLQNIELVLIKDGVAEYEMWAEQDGQMHSFYILFVQDRDGIWRIQFF